MTVAIHVETSITDGPGGDSTLMVSDGQTRLFNQNDCRTTDLDALRQHGPVDLHWLQYSGAIWYPMVYEETPERMRELIDAKVDSQFTRSLKYVDEINAKAAVSVQHDYGRRAQHLPRSDVVPQQAHCRRPQRFAGYSRHRNRDHAARLHRAASNR
jgi:hypothetical protein